MLRLMPQITIVHLYLVVQGNADTCITHLRFSNTPL